MINKLFCVPNLCAVRGVEVRDTNCVFNTFCGFCFLAVDKNLFLFFFFFSLLVLTFFILFAA